MKSKHETYPYSSHPNNVFWRACCICITSQSTSPKNPFSYSRLGHGYAERVSTESDDRDELIKELLAESFGLRTKAEQLSQYVESRVAELVHVKKNLHQYESGQEHMRLTQEIATLRAGLEDLNSVRNQLDSENRRLTHENSQLLGSNLELTAQRDRLRNRSAELERSRAFRLSVRLNRWLKVFGIKDR
jgi:DNA repair exonuclease SbcCD ATPase subunit